jgi:hypothetical protein
MRLRDILISTVAGLLVIVLIISAGLRLDYINSQRQEMKLIANEPLKNAPPSLAFATVAMGAFRGLVVDVLWIRADRLKEEGQFFDARQLAEWITVLQPRFAQVWVFQAWNMAYNISAAIPDEQVEQRWQWVKNGYELLRDKGIPMNPHSILLYQELARIFQHKIGFITDNAHKYYKLQLAGEMEPLLGSADNAWFDALAKAPAQWSDIAADPNETALITALKHADKNFEDESRFVGNYLSLRQNPSRFDPAAFRVIDRFRGTKALNDFDVFAKAWELRNVWKLDPVLMRELNQTYGPTDYLDPNIHYPLDWRHPDSHAIYWAVLGLRVAGNKVVGIKEGRKEYDVAEENTDRIVAGSLQNLFKYGKIFMYDVPSELPPDRPEAAFGTDVNAPPRMQKDIFLRPDLRMFDSYSRAAEKIIAKYVDPNIGFDESHTVQLRNMYSNTLVMFYQAGNRKQAQKIYNFLRNRFPYRPEFKEPAVETFVRDYIKVNLENITISKATDMIMMMLSEAYFRYAVRDDDEAFAREKMAEETYKLYNEKYSDEQRLRIPEFKTVRYNALQDFLRDRQYPLVMRQNLISRIQIERPELYEMLDNIRQQLLKEYQSQAANEPASP